jgi:hypothetical protein
VLGEERAKDTMLLLQLKWWNLPGKPRVTAMHFSILWRSIPYAVYMIRLAGVEWAGRFAPFTINDLCQDKDLTEYLLKNGIVTHPCGKITAESKKNEMCADFTTNSITSSNDVRYLLVSALYSN